MTAPSTFRFALACGVAGAYVDVTGDVLFEEGSIPFTDGRTSEFDGFNPGVFSFTLANADGKYSPDNPATTLATPMSEGMGAVIELDGLLLSGTVRSVALIFPRDTSTPARVRVTCDDMLGDAARTELGSIGDVITATTPYLWWPLDESEGAAFAADANNVVPLSTSAVGVQLGVQGVPGFPSQMRITDSEVNTVGTIPTIPYESSTSLGWWGFWQTPYGGVSAGGFVVSYRNYPAGFNTGFSLRLTTATGPLRPELFVASPPSATLGGEIPAAVPHYLGVHVTQSIVAGTTTLYATPYIDGVAFSAPVSIGSYVGAPASAEASTPTSLSIKIVGTTADFSTVTLTERPVPLQSLSYSTEAERLQGLAAVAPNLAIDTIPAGLSTARLGAANFGQSLLDAFNAVMRTELGYMWVETTGTLTAPVPKIKIAPRNRERALDYTFDVSETLDPIPFIRSLINTVSQATANGPYASATYQEPELVTLVGSANASDAVLFRDDIDLHAYASDRVNRGINRGIAIASITIDATSPNMSRWSDLTAIRQGFRLRITGLPSAQLGYSTWDCFVVGRQIDNTQDSSTDEPKTFFTFYLSPWTQQYVYDDALAVYDTATYGF